MIVSFSREFVFIALPRTGTHAVRSLLRPTLAPNDWEQCTRFEQRLCPVPALAAVGHGHLTATELQSFMIPGMWERFFSFAFVRDPVERFVSAYHLLNRDRELSETETQADMIETLQDPARNAHILYRPQRDFIDGPDGQQVDLIGRHDRFEHDFAQICERIGIAFSAPPRINATPPTTSSPVDAALRSAIRDFYAQDYTRFAFTDRAA